VKLVLDWDGTVTEEDTHTMALLEFGDPELFRRAEVGLERGELTLKECMELEFSGMRAPVGQVNAWLIEHARIRPGFRELAERFKPLILSSSFEELIEPLLAREGVRLDVVANRVDPRPDGWRVLWRDDADCATCGEPCKRSALPQGEVVYVGDGYSDRCVARMAHRVFARDGLAAYLEREGTSFQRFDDFYELASLV
jgi:2-hydroxy-3-keto-5-methylthiopentenyl-1-phosphate phosphatase